MKLILIDGGPASGKSTLGTILAEKLQELGEVAKLLDLDSYVEEFNPKWIWENDTQKEEDQVNARLNFVRDINKHLSEDISVIGIGERFLTKDGVNNFINKLETHCPVFLYHLTIPLAQREQRLFQRGPHSLIDLKKDQKDRDNIKVWPGYIYINIHTPEVDANNLLKLIQEGSGLLAPATYTK